MVAEEQEATFKLIEEIQNIPSIWDVSSPEYKD